MLGHTIVRKLGESYLLSGETQCVYCGTLVKQDRMGDIIGII